MKFSGRFVSNLCKSVVLRKQQIQKNIIVYDITNKIFLLIKLDQKRGLQNINTVELLHAVYDDIIVYYKN